MRRSLPREGRVRHREYALSIDTKSQTIIDAIFAKAAADEQASTVAAEFRDAYARGEWTATGLSAATERAIKAAGEGDA